MRGKPLDRAHADGLVPFRSLIRVETRRDQTRVCDRTAARIIEKCDRPFWCCADREHASLRCYARADAWRPDKRHIVVAVNRRIGVFRLSSKPVKRARINALYHKDGGVMEFSAPAVAAVAATSCAAGRSSLNSEKESNKRVICPVQQPRRESMVLSKEKHTPPDDGFVATPYPRWRNRRNLILE